jgi:hypothetical protein
MSEGIDPCRLPVADFESDRKLLFKIGVKMPEIGMY